MGCGSGTEKERNKVIAWMDRGPKMFPKVYVWLAVFAEYNPLYVGPREKFSGVITVVCKYLLFITTWLENGIKKKPLFFFWLSHDLNFPLKSTTSQLGILAMNYDMKMLKSGHVLGNAYDGDGTRYRMKEFGVIAGLSRAWGEIASQEGHLAWEARATACR